MRHGFALLFTLVLLSIGTPALADVLVFPPERANVTEQEGDAIAALMVDAYHETSHADVRRAAVDRTEAGNPKSYAETASAAHAEEYLVFRVTRLDKKIVVTAFRYQADGVALHQVRMVSSSLDDIELVATRLARALYLKTNPEETRTVHTVTAHEAKPEKHLFSEKIMGIKSSYELAFSKEPMVSFLTIGFDGRLEARHYFLEVGGGFLLPTNDGEVGGIYSEIGASYYLMDENVSPYVGGGVMPRILAGLTDSSNFAVYAQAGVMFFRESSSRLYADIRVAQNLTSWRKSSYWDSDYETQTSSGTAFPTELIFAFGIGW